ncbi:vasorin [Cricetulus griseus]|uniref:Vasorin n=1 Tax=Cricetulus griseus TaxID=10029 RepID=G3HS71_CRIGR|nr:vasorin [Cricetulus griseus]XP_027279805.1 vasorin [Cricetulus griseus]EGW05599.1 Vasorin [Cricetulus griseus]
MHSRSCLPPLLLLLLLLGESGVQGCPSGCQCNQPQTVFCTARQGTTVPRDVPPDTVGLYIFENGITTLDVGSFAGLPGLQLLDLSQNQITSLPGGIFQPLVNLSNLDLTANKLHEISNETFRGLRRLERLYLGKNRIRHIQPGAFDALDHLLELKLEDNELRLLPPLHLPRLLLLDLSYNNIPALESGVLHTANVEALRLAGLGLRQLDEGLFGRLRNLHDLDVSDNQLEHMPSVIQGLRGLTRLRLAGNTRIAHIRPEDLAGLTALQELDVSNLSLQALPSDLSNLFPRLRLLAAARNPFNCLCPLSWFGPWVRESHVVLASPEETRCHFPPKNAGRLLLDLDYADFGCPVTTTTATVPTIRPTIRESTLSPSNRASTWPSLTEPTTQASTSPSTAPPTMRPVPQPQDCPASTCLNGGTCRVGARHHRECLCPEGFIGLYCESPVRQGMKPSSIPDTPRPPRPLPLSIEPVSPTSLRVGLQRYLQGNTVQLRSLRLTYRNLSGPDKRLVTLRLPASLAEYTVTQLRPNATYSICVTPLGAGRIPEGEEACGEASTPQAVRSNHAPVTQAREGNLPLLIAPALAAVLLAVLAAAGAAYCVRRGRTTVTAQDKGQVGPGTGPLELEGVKAPLEPSSKATEGVGEALSGGPECEVPLMGYSGPSLQGPLPAKHYI